MKNEEGVLKQFLLVANQNQRVFNEILMELRSRGMSTTRLEGQISKNGRYTQDLEKLILGDDYGKPTNLPVL